MQEFIEQCRAYGVETRIVQSFLRVELEEVIEVGGAFLEEFMRLNQFEEAGIEKWVRNVKGRDFEGDDVVLDLLIEMYKKLDLIERRLDQETNLYLPLKQKMHTACIGHQILCFNEADFWSEKTYYARIELPLFPREVIPCFCRAIGPQVLEIVKIGEKYTRQLDAYVVECERMEILARKKE